MRTSAIDPWLGPELRRPSKPGLICQSLFSSKLDRLVRGTLKRPIDFCPSLDQKRDEFRKLQSGKCVAINEMWEKT